MLIMRKVSKVCIHIFTHNQVSVCVANILVEVIIESLKMNDFNV